jgi:hypothetical protein
MSQEHMANQLKRYAAEATAMAFQQRPFAGPASNTVPFNPTAIFGAGAVGNQHHLPAMVPSVEFPGAQYHCPFFSGLAFPVQDPNSILSRRAANKHPHDMASNSDTNLQSTTADTNLQTPAVREFLAHGSSSSGLSKEEVPIAKPRGATREHREDVSTSSGLYESEALACKPRGTSQERRDSLTQQSSISVLPMKRSRLPSTDAPRKAPHRAATSPLSDSEEEDYNNSGQKRPKAKQQRLSANLSSAVKAKRTQHPSTPAVDPKNILNRRREADITDLGNYQDEPPRQLPEIGLFSPPKVAARSHLRHKYVVPESLQGTAKALGKFPLHIPPWQHPGLLFIFLTLPPLRTGHLERLRSLNGTLDAQRNLKAGV